MTRLTTSFSTGWPATHASFARHETVIITVKQIPLKPSILLSLPRLLSAIDDNARIYGSRFLLITMKSHCTSCSRTTLISEFQVVLSLAWSQFIVHRSLRLLSIGSRCKRHLIPYSANNAGDRYAGHKTTAISARNRKQWIQKWSVVHVYFSGHFTKQLSVVGHFNSTWSKNCSRLTFRSLERTLLTLHPQSYSRSVQNRSVFSQ